MAIEKRLAKLEAARGQAVKPIHNAAFAEVVAALDTLAGELAQGGEAETKAREELGGLMTELCL